MKKRGTRRAENKESDSKIRFTISLLLNPIRAIKARVTPHVGRQMFVTIATMTGADIGDQVLSKITTITVGRQDPECPFPSSCSAQGMSSLVLLNKMNN